MQLNDNDMKIILDALRVAHSTEYRKLINYGDSFKLGKLSKSDYDYLNDKISKSLKNYKSLITKLEY